jgi:protocatechuate 3,4-dioxygenase beta subunit
MRRAVVLALVASVLVVAGWALLAERPGPDAAAPEASGAGPEAPAAPGPPPTGLAPAALRGAVLEADGAPADGAAVSVLAGGRVRAAVTAGDDGAFRIEGLEPGEYLLVARRDDRAAAPVGPVPLAPGEELAGLTLVLAPGGSLAGTVLDAGTREPIEGATVAAAGASATTDRIGRFRLRGLPPGPTVLAATAPGYEPREAPLELYARAETGFEVALSRGARIRGRVLSSGGEPVAGAQVRPVPYRFDGAEGAAAGAAAGADGSFDLASPAGTVRVEGSSPAGEAGRTELFDLAPGTVKESVELRLAPAAALAGTVRGADGTPVPGAAVQVASVDGKALAAGVADVDGHFGFSPLPPGPVTVAAASGEARGHAGPLELAEGGAARADVTLGAETLDGIVVDAGGRPLPGASVAAWPEGGSRGLAATAVAGPDGTFSLHGLPVELHRVEAAFGEARGEVRGLVPGAAGARIVVGGGVLVGVVSVDGRPATDFTVALAPADPGQGGARALRVLAPDGRFRIAVAPGRWDVRAGAPGATAGQASATVPAGGASAEVRLDLVAGGTIAGTVLDADGRPIEGARVSTSRLGTWAMTRASSFPGAPRTITGADGGFRLSGVPAGTVPLFAFHPAYRPARPTWVDVAPDAPARVELRLQPAPPGDDGPDAKPFGGVGLTLGPTRDGVLAFGVVEGGPAFEAGIRNGDRIHEVDGLPVDGRPIDELVARIRGPVGTPVVFDLSRPSAGGARFRAVAVRAELHF